MVVFTTLLHVDTVYAVYFKILLKKYIYATMNIKLLAVGTLAIASLGDAASSFRTKHPRVVVIGGGFAGLGAATTLQVSMIRYRIKYA